MPLGFGEKRTINIILHGYYQPEEITMPVRPGDQFLVSGSYTRHNLISSTLLKSLGKPMTVKYQRSSAHNRIILCKLHQSLSRRSLQMVPMWSQGVPAHRLFVYVLQKNGGFDSVASNRLFWSVGGQWSRVVSILAFRHRIESDLEQFVARDLPRDYPGYKTI
jgi:hypothetical protein